MKNQSEITFEIEETIVVRDGVPAILFCERCMRKVPMSTPQTAALLSGMTEREIFRLLESELVHFSEGGRVLICLESVRLLGKEIIL